eukprot:TRINITY_DN2580_c0_g6_i1.p2 TRINITY_DN2580_c0_g6~~TRINITY_DN2580_c0_g6_i1.p2  ORF type:complete len:121 (-),score=14.95 TRINITY_DN2580_c0_g6_i1:393-755(-)
MMRNFFVILLLAMLNLGVSATYPEEYQEYYYPKYDYYEYKEPYYPYEYYPYTPYDYYPTPKQFKKDVYSKQIDIKEIAKNVYPRMGSVTFEKMQKYMEADGTNMANKYCLRILGYPCYKN